MAAPTAQVIPTGTGTVAGNPAPNNPPVSAAGSAIPLPPSGYHNPIGVTGPRGIPGRL